MKSLQFISKRNEELSVFLLKRLFPGLGEGQAIILIKNLHFKKAIKVLNHHWFNENHINGHLIRDDIQKWINCEIAISNVLNNTKRQNELFFIIKEHLNIRNTVEKNCSYNNKKKNELIKNYSTLLDLLANINREFELERARCIRDISWIENKTILSKNLNKIEKKHHKNCTKVINKYYKTSNRREKKNELESKENYLISKTKAILYKITG